MSQQSLENMISVAQGDRLLCEQLQKAETPEAFVEIGAIYGYQFSVKELITFMKARFGALIAQQSKAPAFLENLSDDEAEMIADGRLRAYSVSVNSYYHQTGLLVDLPGSFAMCGIGFEDFDREFYSNAFDTNIYGKLISTITRYTSSFGIVK